MSDLIAAFLVVIGFEEPETLPRSLHPLKPDSAWSPGGWVLEWNELQNVQWDISHRLPRLISRQRCSLLTRRPLKQCQMRLRKYSTPFKVKDEMRGRLPYRFAGCNLWSGREGERERAFCGFCDTDFGRVPSGGVARRQSRSRARVSSAVDAMGGGERVAPSALLSSYLRSAPCPHPLMQANPLPPLIRTAR